MITVTELDDYIAARRYRLIDSVLVYQNNEVVLDSVMTHYYPDDNCIEIAGGYNT
jgi:hypothetical protein